MEVSGFNYTKKYSIVDLKQTPTTESTKGLCESLKHSRIGRLFWDKKFLNYTITGFIISALNVFLLWLFIDVLGIGTVTAGISVVLLTFILRYVLLVFFKIF